MRTFKQYIIEIGDSSYNWEHVGSDKSGEYHHYHITHPTDNSKDTSVSITHGYPETEGGKHAAEVVFNRANKGFAATNDMTVGESAKVFSTVHKILKHHAEKHPSVSHFVYTSDKEEASRSKLYDRFTNRIGGEIDRSNERRSGYTEYKIPVENL